MRVFCDKSCLLKKKGGKVKSKEVKEQVCGKAGHLGAERSFSTNIVAHTLHLPLPREQKGKRQKAKGRVGRTAKHKKGREGNNTRNRQESTLKNRKLANNKLPRAGLFVSSCGVSCGLTTETKKKNKESLLFWHYFTVCFVWKVGYLAFWISSRYW